MNRKTLAATLVIIGAGLLIYAAAALDPIAGFALAGILLIAGGLFGVDV
jgi:hypothetical protein